MITKLDASMLACLGLVLLTSARVSTFGKDPASSTNNIDITQAHAPLNIRSKPQPEINKPDFSTIKDTKRKKKEFFGFMLPLIQEENRQIMINREHVKQLQKKKVLTDIDQQWLTEEANLYEIDTDGSYNAEFFTQLLQSLDIVPPSLALAQSANESAWGTSRFAQKGNNFFGQWCFNKGCGIIPSSRPSGKTYEVRRFVNVFESVRSYMHNLNTNHHYKSFRVIRAKKRHHKQPITGPVLADGLQSYSIRGQKYINELVDMINDNQLLSYDTQNNIPEA